MGATPNFDQNTAGYGSTGGAGSMDDVSLTGGTGTGTTGGTAGGAATGGTGAGASTGSGGSQDQSAMDNAKQTVREGVNSAEDALTQLQAKAGELTSRLIDNIDLDDLTQKLEVQVRNHPTRTLLVALGAGFLLGRTVKR